MKQQLISWIRTSERVALGLSSYPGPQSPSYHGRQGESPIDQRFQEEVALLRLLVLLRVMRPEWTKICTKKTLFSI